MKSNLKSRVVSREEAEAYAEKQGLMYVETSAKESINVDEAFVGVAQSVLGSIKDQTIDPHGEVS